MSILRMHYQHDFMSIGECVMINWDEECFFPPAAFMVINGDWIHRIIPLQYPIDPE